MDEKTWLDEYHDAMKTACERKKTRTKGVCEDYECYGLGWCKECLDVARKGEHEPENEG